ncbi:MAG: hypothetical protein HY060_12350, partial [Proteobacteria bacterium]|nr:hypothetical protein [Pseudomonadota bacterium]
MPASSPWLSSSTNATRPDTPLIAPLGQEAVVGAVLLASQPLDQLAQLAPEAAVPSGADPAAAPASDGETKPVGDGLDAPATAGEIPPVDGQLPDGSATSYTGHIPVTLSVFASGMQGFATDALGASLGSKIIPISAFQYDSTPVHSQFHAIPQDHNLIGVTASAARSSATATTDHGQADHGQASHGSGVGSVLLTLTGGGTDTLSLDTGTISISIASLDSIFGSAGNDTVVMTTPVSGAKIDLAGGTDTLTLANGTNSLNIANVESIVGGTGADTLVLIDAGGHTVTGGGSGDSITSGGGADVFKYAASSDSFTNAVAAADAHTDQIANFNDSGPAAKIDLTGLAGAGTESFAGAKAGATFALAFA